MTTQVPEIEVLGLKISAEDFDLDITRLPKNALMRVQ